MGSRRNLLDRGSRSIGASATDVQLLVTGQGNATQSPTACRSPSGERGGVLPYLTLERRREVLRFAQDVQFEHAPLPNILSEAKDLSRRPHDQRTLLIAH